MKVKPIKYLLILPVVLVMVMIFVFSSEDATKSSETSGRVVNFIIELINKDYDKMEENEKEEYYNKVSFIVRKLAHFSIFALLSFFMIIMFSSIILKYHIFRISLLTFSISSLYAMSDEIHQFYTSGRAMEVRDLLIDMAGIVFGIMFFMLIRLLFKNKKNKEV